MSHLNSSIVISKEIRLFIFFSLFLTCVFGQDTIVTVSGKQLFVDIDVVSSNRVKYRETGQPESVQVRFKQHFIREIKYAPGKESLLNRKNPRYYRPLGLTAGFTRAYGADFASFGFTLDYFIIRQMALNVSLGEDAAFGTYQALGTNFHFNRRIWADKVTAFAGFQLVNMSNDAGLLMPIGINIIGKQGLRVALAVNFPLYWQFKVSAGR